MFDIGWTEMLVVAVVAIVVVGPKDLPQMLRAFGKTMKSVRKMAGDFQRQFDDAIKEADLDDVKKIASGNSFKPLDDIKDSTEAFKKQVKEQMEASVLPEKTASAEPKLPEPSAPAEKVSTPSSSGSATGEKKPANPAAKTTTKKAAKPASKKPSAGKKA